jgi:methylmalonyl-CoA/ethylmalonyl-CoA epimerase
MIGAKSVHHIGIVVRSIDEQREFYEEALGARLESLETVPDEKMRIGTFVLGRPGAEVRLELLEATGEGSPLAAFLSERGAGLHHIAYSVESIEARLRDAAALGIGLVDAEPRTGPHGRKIAFLDPRSTHGVLTELCEAAAPGSEAVGGTAAVGGVRDDAAVSSVTISEREAQRT